MAKASPVNYVNGNDPPFLIIQGEKDPIVPPSQSQALYDKLKAAGVPATLVMVKNGGHVFAADGRGLSARPCRRYSRLLTLTLTACSRPPTRTHSTSRRRGR